ncbi:MAG: hypothetical protein ACRDQZ_26600, partial [Mycobacteriales bacterium]
ATQRQVVNDFQNLRNRDVNVHLIEIDELTKDLRANDGMFSTYDIHPNFEAQRVLAKGIVQGKLGEEALALRPTEKVRTPMKHATSRTQTSESRPASRRSESADRPTGSRPNRVSNAKARR